LSYDWKHLAKIGRKAVKEPFPVAAERMPRVLSRKKQHKTVEIVKKIASERKQENK